MKKYEYDYVQGFYQKRMGDAMILLKERGEAGWELCHVTENPGLGFLFKREVISEAKRPPATPPNLQE